MSDASTGSSVFESEPEAVSPKTEQVFEAVRKKRQEAPQGIWRGWVRPLLVVVLVVTALRSTLVDWNDVPTGSMEPTVAVGDRIVVNKLAYGFNLPFNGPAFSIPFVPTKEPIWNPLDFLPGFYYSRPDRGDIVTFWKPKVHQWIAREAVESGASLPQAQENAQVQGGGIRMVKRIVAVPGDTIEMRPASMKMGGRVYHYSTMTINGQMGSYVVQDADAANVVLLETLQGQTRQLIYKRNEYVWNPAKGRKEPFPAHPKAYSFGPVTLEADEYLMIGDNRDNSLDGRYFGPVTLKQITGKAKFVAVSFEKGQYTSPKWSRFFRGFEYEASDEK